MTFSSFEFVWRARDCNRNLRVLHAMQIGKGSCEIESVASRFVMAACFQAWPCPSHGCFRKWERCFFYLRLSTLTPEGVQW